MASPICMISKQADRSSEEKREIHSIPCRISYNGPAKVSCYFVQEEDNDGKKRAAFRGHGLEGVKLDLPPHYELCVLKKRAGDIFDIESRQRSFMLWEWDREAGERSAAARALSLLKIAHALADD